MRSGVDPTILASAAAGIPNGAVCAWAQAADSFEVVPRPPEDRTAAKGVIKREAASRQKSRLAKFVAKLPA